VTEITTVEMGLMNHCIATRSVVVMRLPARMVNAFLLCGDVMDWTTVETIQMRKIAVSTELLRSCNCYIKIKKERPR
jgi:hypothetical protein